MAIFRTLPFDRFKCMQTLSLSPVYALIYYPNNYIERILSWIWSKVVMVRMNECNFTKTPGLKLSKVGHTQIVSSMLDHNANNIPPITPIGIFPFLGLSMNNSNHLRLFGCLIPSVSSVFQQATSIHVPCHLLWLNFFSFLSDWCERIRREWHLFWPLLYLLLIPASSSQITYAHWRHHSL